MLHSRLLEYIDGVARHGSIRAAGARLHVTPSAINRQILLLEKELGEPLFERMSRGMRPTPAGEVLLTHIRSTQQQYRETLTEMHASQSLPRGEVMIASMNGLASSIVATAAASFHARYPGVRISIRVMFAHETLQAVVGSEADLGLGFNLAPSGQIEIYWEKEARLGAVIAPEHPLARMKTIPLSHCADYPLILADRFMLIHGIVADAFAEAGIEVEPAFRTSSIETMKRLASSGDTIAFLSRYDINEEQHDGRLVFRQVNNHAFKNNVLSLVRREHHSAGLASQLFADEIVGTLESVMA